MTPWLSFQLADSAFPSGGFAHSGGLEAAVQLGRCRGPAGLDRFVEEALWQAGSLALPFVVAALRAPERLAELDARCDAATPGHVANRASRAQGRALLRAAIALGPAARALEEEVTRGGLAGHLAPVSGALLARLGASEEEAAQLYLFVVARGIVSAGVRLGLIGPLEAQAALARAGAVAETVLAASAGRAPEDAAASSPLLDLLQSHQDRLYSRLFQS
ncbi:MAG TPA: urease accessory UreF family protein [Anaeromyxobacter sp.]|nr:urease accessory UreF family protein [Anaeromyxobacter sp.]